MTNKQRAWVAVAARKLGRAGSWTGRTHLHKHLFIVKSLGLAKVPFEFELYHYGPYSFELDGVVAEMEAFGDLNKTYRRVGYGPSYEATALGKEAIAELDPEEVSAAKAVAAELAPYDSADLELIATCLFVEIIEGETADELIVPRVEVIKPKYSVSQIERALKCARKLRDHLKR
jgi:uncharacterized protein YwgA